MTKIRELVKKLRTEYRTESVIADMSKTVEFSSFTVISIPQAGLVAGRTLKEGRHTVCFTPLDPFGEETEEEFNKAKKSTLQEQVEGVSGRRPLGQLGKSTG